MSSSQVRLRTPNGAGMKSTSFHRISLVNPDPAFVREDATAKSIAFFAKVRPVFVDRAIYDELKQISISRGNKNVRLCLHSAPEDNQHDMIILERKGTLYRPHRHPGKAETFHVVEGRMAVFNFDAKGEPAEVGVVHPGEIYRLDLKHYHTVMPLDDFVIYHEAKVGPFLGDDDFIFPPWGPRAGDDAAMREFFARCNGLLGSDA